jgi:hypothetical protein
MVVRMEKLNKGPLIKTVHIEYSKKKLSVVACFHTI